jgi:hypothetical protein
MRVLNRDIDRKRVIEAYVRYDCSKKNLPMPELVSSTAVGQVNGTHMPKTWKMLKTRNEEFKFSVTLS